MARDSRHARDWRLYAAAGVGALLLAYPSGGYCQPSGQPNAHGQYSSAGPSLPVATAAADEGGPDESAGPASHDHEPDWFGISSESLTARATFVLMVATVLLGAGTVALAVYTRRLVLDGAKNLHAARVSARIAHRAVRQAKESALVHAKESNVNEIRAYVLVATAIIENIGDPSARRAIITMKNYGLTPALHMRFWVGVGARPWPNWTQFEQPIDLMESRETLPQTRESMHRVPLTRLTDDWEAALQRGDMAIYMWGQATYTDIFGIERQTDFRLACSKENGLADGLMNSASLDANRAT